MLTHSLLGQLALSLLASTAAATFSASAKNNVAIYWGQGPNQLRLVETCKNSNIDVINLAFINVFPDQGAGGYPGSNFGNACAANVYTHNGKKTQLYSNCKYIGPDIKTCQKTYGKKIIMSLGGGYPTDQYLVSDQSAVNFATFLWGAFGPPTKAWTNANKPRPFGDAVVDGFDFDVESEISPAPTYKGKKLNDYKTRGYGTMISTFRKQLFVKDKSKRYYISAAPQCIVPDSHYGSLVQNYWFDFLFVQFYNNPQCSARAGIQHIQGNNSNDISFNQWSKIKSYNKDVKVYLGLPANTNASGLASYYLSPAELQTLVNKFYSNAKFGGIMLWEATYAMNNVICGSNYATWSKKILNAKKNGSKLSAPGTNSSCNSKRDTPFLQLLHKRETDAVLPTAPLPASSDPAASVVSAPNTSAPAPAPAASSATDTVAPTAPVVFGASLVSSAVEAPAPSVEATAASIDTATSSATEPTTLPSTFPQPIIEAPTSSAESSGSSSVVAPVNATRVDSGSATDSATATSATTGSIVGATGSVLAATVAANSTQAAAQTSTNTTAGSSSTSSLASSSSTNSTGHARLKAAVANATAAAVTGLSASNASSTASLDTMASLSLTATADAIDGTITPAPKIAKADSNGTEATQFLTETITNIVYETLSTCAPSVTDCAHHPESQTVVFVTSTIDVITTKYISGDAAPSPETLYSNIYNTINVYYASAGADSGFGVNAKLYNPHADDDQTTTTTISRTTTVLATKTIHASRTTTTLTSTVTVYPDSSEVAAVKAADQAVADTQPSTNVDANTNSGSDTSSSDPNAPAAAAPAANVKLAKATDDSAAAPAAAPAAYKAVSPTKSFAVPGNSTTNLKLVDAARQGNTNATGFRAVGGTPAALALQAKAVGDATSNGNFVTGDAARRIGSGWTSVCVAGVAAIVLAVV